MAPPCSWRNPGHGPAPRAVEMRLPVGTKVVLRGKRETKTGRTVCLQVFHIRREGTVNHLWKEGKEEGGDSREEKGELLTLVFLRSIGCSHSSTWGWGVGRLGAVPLQAQ